MKRRAWWGVVFYQCVGDHLLPFFGLENILLERANMGVGQRDLLVVATSGAVTKKTLEAGVKRLKSVGASVRLHPSVAFERGYLAGSARARARAFLGAQAERSHLIIGARGGFGALELLAFLDDEAFSGPASIMGFSDMTALLLRQLSLGRGAVHGPTVQSLAEASPRTMAAVESLLFQGHYEDPLQDGWESVCSGEAEGVLSGGNLVTLASMCGTPWQPSFNGMVLAIEEVNEAPYRVERALVQLSLAGAVYGVRGIVLGEFLGCGEKGEVEALFKERFSMEGIPVIAGGLFGHGETNFPLAFGRRVHLSSARGVSYVHA